uniref:protein JINGUBANG-like n=1 Tax=Erigeron canadensis TaxID=72917 RepID=UPI001CB9C4A2|nr:protein JINGUBANG-like [Erigeron canadensis]
MKLRPFISICSTNTTNTTPQAPPPPLKKLVSSNTNTINISHTTIGGLTLTISHQRITSLKPLPSCHVDILAIHDNLLYAATGNLIHLIDATSFAILDTFSDQGSSSGSVKSVTFSNGHIFTAHQDNKIRVWKLIENKYYHHKHIATLPTFEDRLFRSVLPKNYVQVRRHCKKLWIQHQDAVSGLALVTEQLICSVSWDRYLKIWQASDFRCLDSIKVHDDAVNSVVVSVNGTIFTGSADCKIKIWGKVFGKYKLIVTLEKHKSAVNALALNEDGSLLFSGGSDRVIMVWVKEHGSNNYMVLAASLRGHLKAVLCLVYVCDLLFSGSADRTVRIWQRGCEGKFCCLKVLDGYERPVRSLVVDRGIAKFGSKVGPNFVRVFSECSNGVIRMVTIEDLSLSNSVSTYV